jgi:SpoVK/Ycf46/Vps4 family AAA+-type ATPase
MIESGVRDIHSLPILGFALTSILDLLRVEGLSDPIIDADVIDKLVLRPQSTKEMIKGICETYNDRDEDNGAFFADFIHGKGEGQILLLHGPPGTGKTLTAGMISSQQSPTRMTLTETTESVAEYTERPLLSITAADLGQDSERMERNLLKFFRNATKWDALVLLDEADVYLERRSPVDLDRNGIVSGKIRPK